MKIILIGAYGRMGEAVSALAEEAHILQKIGSSSPNDLSSFLPDFDLVLDFSTPKALTKNLPKVLLAKKPIVIGTTGHSSEELQAIYEAAKEIPIFLSPNFSPGIALLKKLIAHLPQGNYEITEVHHTQKKDSPSGTALNLAQNLPTTPKITSHREGDVLGQHTITLHLPYETLKLSHEVLDRKVFAEGALLACTFLSNKPKGLYTSIYD